MPGADDWIFGTANADTLNGDITDNAIVGRDGDDTLNGAASNDWLLGGNGVDTLYGSYGDDILLGEAGNDELHGDSGDDVLDGGTGNDELNGGAGSDQYIFTGGLDEIYETGADQDRLKIDMAVTVSDISINNTGTVDATLVVNSGTNEVLLDNLRGTGTDDRVELVEFIDGFIADLTDYTNWTWGTDTGEIHTGDANDNTIIAKDGADTIDGAAGADTAHGGEGADVIDGGAGDDFLHGGAGNDTIDGEGDDDTLLGGDGADTLTGGAGVDTLTGGDGADVFKLTDAASIDNVTDFNDGDGDVINLEDILSGYDPLTDLITDWVEITDSGNDSILKIDQAGTGGTYSMTQIALLEGVTGLTDETALETASTLVA